MAEKSVSQALSRIIARSVTTIADNIRGRCDDERRRYLDKTQWMKKEDIKRLQFRRLKNLLAHAYENVSHYHESFKKSKLRPADLKTLDDLRKVPVLKKSEIRNELDKMIAVGYPSKELIPFLTSGTTAAPLRFYRSKTDMSWGYGAGLRAYEWAGYRPGDKRAVIWEFPDRQLRSLAFRLYHYLIRDKILNVHDMSEESMKLFARKLHRFKPHFIRSYCASLNLFACFILENSQFEISPNGISTSAATLLPSQRKTIETAFHCKVHDFYGSREITSIAAQCGKHEGLHVSDENIILEIEKDGETASCGENGRILLTNLNSHAMPFIRYDIGDSGKLFSDTCSCGRSLSLVKPTGRTYEYFINSDGSFTYLRDIQLVFEDLPIKEYQIVQQSYDEIVIKIVPRPGYSAVHSDFILQNLRLRGKAKIRIETVDSVPIEESGKARYVVRKLPSKYT